MKVRLLRDTRIRHAAGDVVDVRDPLELDFLVSTGSAEVLRAEAPQTPEAETVRETRAAKPTTTVKKTARKQ